MRWSHFAALMMLLQNKGDNLFLTKEGHIIHLYKLNHLDGRKDRGGFNGLICFLYKLNFLLV
jgi:hypothetical protein